MLSGCASILRNIMFGGVLSGLTRDHQYMFDSYPLDAGLGQTSVRFKLLYGWHISKGEKFTLGVEVRTDESIQKEESLTFIVDGEVITFSSYRKDLKTTKDEFGTGVNSWSIRFYRVSREFIDKTLSAEKVLVRIELDKTYAEADFASEIPNSAKGAMKKFIAKLESCMPTHTCAKADRDRRRNNIPLQ